MRGSTGGSSRGDGVMDGLLGGSGGRSSRDSGFNGNGCLAFGSGVMVRGVGSVGRRKNGVGL